jgi:hypothetical protein
VTNRESGGVQRARTSVTRQVDTRGCGNHLNHSLVVLPENEM